MRNIKKILVTGASGFLGSHICEVLHEQGYEVHALVRSISSRAWLGHPWLKIHEGEFHDRTVLPLLLNGVEAVVHSAAELIGASEQELYKTNVNATRILAEESIKAGVKRFVFISSRDAGGVSKNGIPKSESDPDEPYSPYGKSKKMAEGELSKLKDKIMVINLRPVLIYGPREKHLFRLFQLIKQFPVAPILGTGLTYMPLVYVRDVANAAAAALCAAVPSGSTYYISDGMSHTFDILYRHIASSLEKKLRIVRIPTRLAALFVGILFGSRSREMALTPQTVLEFRHRFRLVSIEKAKKELNWEPKIMLHEGIPLTIAWYKKEGWLEAY